MLKHLREEVHKANLDLVKHGLITLTFGNASGIDREAGHVAIKPSGVAYEDMKPAHMVVVDLDGKVVEGDLRPSSDTPTHLALYKAWPAIGGITHTHSPQATAFAQACRSIPCLGTTHADAFYGEVPVTRPLTEDEVKSDYEGNTGKVILETFAAGTPGAASRTSGRRSRAAGSGGALLPHPMEVPAVLVANHGPFAWGKSAAESVKIAVILEEVAKMALGALQLDPRRPGIPQYILDKHYFRKHGPGAYYGQK